MTERDTEIEFDFFEEPATREAARPDTGARRIRPPRRPAGPPSGLTPLLRLVGLISFAILVVLLLVLWVSSCRGEAKQDRYQAYMADVQEIAQQSERVGAQLTTTLTRPEVRQPALVRTLDGYAQQQEQSVANAQRLDPPGPLREQQEHLVQALQFRVSGLRGMADGFGTRSGNANQIGQLLSAQSRRLAASDVIWDDLFKDQAVAVLRDQDITGVEVPDSNFVQTRDLASTGSMVPIWERINGSAASGGGPAPGLHGTGIESVRAIPGGTTLSESTENTIEASTDLAFEVAVANTGDNQEVRIEVTLTIQQSPTPIVKKQTIPIINVGETKTVVFRDFPSVDFGEKRTMRIDVAPVPNEKNKANNTAEYPVIFSLGA
jgi:hypothetical protein